MLDTTALTPLQQVGNFLVKRDDLFEIAGVRGSEIELWTRRSRPRISTGHRRDTGRSQKHNSLILLAASPQCRSSNANGLWCRVLADPTGVITTSQIHSSRTDS